MNPATSISPNTGAKLPNRQSIRMRGWDYTAAGYYFVTINTHGNRALFGVVVNGRMVLSEAGRIAEEEWHKSVVIRRGIELDEFVVMPNHVHGIVRFEGQEGAGLERRAGLAGAGLEKRAGLDAPSPYPQFGKPIAGALGTFVGAYKGAVSREINRRGLVNQVTPQGHSLWHRNYWDVIVRDEKALANIRSYIRFNPQNYDAVMQVGEPRLLGNAELLKLPKMGFLASRGYGLDARSPYRDGEAIISGFLSPMERAVLKAGLEQKRPLIWVMPFGTGLDQQAPAVRRALDDGRLLAISPFDDEIDAPSVRRAAWCNHTVLAHCDRLVVGHLTPGGMLSCLLSEADPELEITYL